ncbi:MAG TPA: NAD(P)/FAD-dependent oxidoreductase [Gemmatimonadales bacterium]|nr:NAD(P)/FAD-dependent oxidoreductase [Gemmatimonadales bacterium]
MSTPASDAPAPAAGPCHVGIVGGGLLGMTLALRLRAQGHRVTLVEAAPAPGGLASAAEIGGYTWDRFYHVILLSDLHTRGLLGELGLEDRLRWGQTRTGFYSDGRLHSLSSSLEYLTFPLLNPLDKARLAATILHAARVTRPEPLEAIPVVEWLTRWSGRRVVERLWLPLLRAKLGENWRHASAAFIWAIIARMYAARRSGLKREMMGYVDGGYALVLERLEAALRARGVALRCGCPVAEVRPRAGGGAEVVLRDGERLAVDQAVLTVPAGRAATLLPGLTAAERRRLEGVTYQGIVCASALLARPLGGYYVTNITDAWVPFTGVIEMTALVDRARFGGHTLVYLPRYLTQDDAFWRQDDAAVEAEFTAALLRMYPHLTRADIRAFRVARVREVLAVPTLHYSRDALPPTATSLESIHLVNSAQIVNGTLNVNETVALADAKARELAPRLRAHPDTPRPAAPAPPAPLVEA